MFTLTGTLTATTEAEAADARAHADEHIRLSRAEPGCIRFEMIQKDDPMVWHLDEAFADADAFAAHQARTAATVWAEKSANMLRDFKKNSD